MGCYATADGRETRWAAVVRSDNLAALRPAGRRALLDYGVRSMVDLRLPEEVADHPNPFAEPDSHGIAYANVSIFDPAVPPPDPGVVPLVVAGVALAAMIGLAVAQLMAERRRRRPPRTPAERLVELLDDTLEDLEREPDPRRAATVDCSLTVLYLHCRNKLEVRSACSSSKVGQQLSC
jgi:hypothetical protein